MSGIATTAYKTFLKEIKERIHKAQYDAFKAVHKELIALYWDIGKSIVVKQAKLAIQDEYSFDFLEIGGIILCKDKNRTIVEYALKDTKKPIGVSTYKLTEKLPRELKKYLPSPAEMIERIKYLE